ncbi:hypothetical protein HA402_000411 [Bradysia odoriphaga]|nr:hypothetical protein HA402_000411 [Bradysia odoriphaga]
MENIYPACIMSDQMSAPKENPNGYHFIAADLGQAESADIIAKKVLEQFGRTDIIINNAGANLNMGGSFSAITDEHWQQDFQLNLIAAVRINKAFLPAMIDQKSGAIINISTYAARQPIWEMTMTYSAAKAALNAYTKALSYEVGPRGTRVNAVSPGVVKTPLMEDFIASIAQSSNIPVDEAFKSVMSRVGEVPMGRMAEPEEIANLVAFLASPEAKYITGANYLIDGGLSPAV